MWSLRNVFKNTNIYIYGWHDSYDKLEKIALISLSVVKKKIGIKFRNLRLGTL